MLHSHEPIASTPGSRFHPHRLTLGGSNFEIGAGLARVALAEHGVGPAPALDSKATRDRREWFSTHYQQMSERMAGVAAASGLAEDDDRYDFGELGHGMQPGCSVSYHPPSTTKSGHALLNRNFDFPTATFAEMLGMAKPPDAPPMMGSPYLLELHPDAGPASLAVHAADLLGGAFDGVNEHGLVVALLADDDTPQRLVTGTPQPGVAEHQVTRYLLDTCQSAAEARELLRSLDYYARFVNCHFLVADATGDAFVWERIDGVDHFVTVAGDSPLVVTNHLLHRYPDGPPAGEDGNGYTYRRHRVLTDRYRNGPPATFDSLVDASRAVRFSAPAPEGRTLWHAVYDATERSVAVSFHLADGPGDSDVRTPYVRASLAS